MAVVYNGQVRMAYMAIVAGFSVNGVARLHTEILKHEELKDFYEMMPEKFNNKTNGITQRRFLLHGNPLLADWVTDKSVMTGSQTCLILKNWQHLQMIRNARRNSWISNIRIKSVWLSTSRSITALTLIQTQFSMCR